MCCTPTFKHFFFQASEEEGEEGEGGEGAAEEEEDDTVYQYIPPESKEWVSQGSEKEISEQSVVESRRKVSHFGIRGNIFHTVVPIMEIFVVENMHNSWN